MKKATQCPSREEIEAVLLSVDDEEARGELAHHLDLCASCRSIADSIDQQSLLEADLNWASQVREQTPVDIKEPFRRLSMILSDYEILGELGRGGMGVVYKARQPKLDRLVAIKVLPTLISLSRPDAKARFRREAKLAAGLEHTGIISVYDFGEIDGTLYFTMQLINGRSLSSVLEEIKETGSFESVTGAYNDKATQSHADSSKTASFSRPSKSNVAYYRMVASWVADVADALQYAHEMGVTHRDIKPSNLLIRDDGRIMISDFGLARSHDEDSITVTRTLIGTCRYLSPEQIDSSRGPADALVDVYALGATLYEMLTLHPIFSGRDDKQIFHNVLSNDPIPPHRHNPSIPRELETICLKAIEKNRNSRYASAAQLADDLRRWLLDLPIQARRQSPTQRALRAIRRRRIPITMGVIIAALSAISLGLTVAIDGIRTQGRESESRAMLQEAMLSEQEASTSFRLEQYEPALRSINHALALAPNRSSSVHLKARLLLRNTRRAEAVDLLHQYLEVNQDDLVAHFLAGYGLHYHFGHPPNFPAPAEHETHAEHDDNAKSLRTKWAKLLDHIHTVEALAIDSPEAICLRSCIEPSHEIAIESLTTAIEMAPEFTEAIVERAVRKGFLEDWESALTDLNRAIKLKHGGDRVYGLQSISLYHLDRYAESESALTRAIELNPGQIDWWYNRAVVRVFQNKHAEAIKDSTRAIEIDPQYEFAYVTRARGKDGLGDFEGALNDYNLAESIDPSNPDIFSERCQMHIKLGNVPEALADANTLIGMSPGSARSYLRRAQVYLLTGQWDEAIEDLNTSDELGPDDYTTRYLIATAYFKSNRLDEAEQAYDIASALNPTEYDSYLYRAQSLVRLGRRHEAVAMLTRWITSAKPAEMGYLRRGAVYQEMEEHSLAIADYRAAAETNPALKSYADLWTAIILTEQGDLPQAKLLLGQLADNHSTWESRIAQHLLARPSTQALVEYAQSEDQRAESLYYAGIRAQWEGNTEAAARSFEQCVETARPVLFEREFARGRLETINHGSQ